MRNATLSLIVTLWAVAPAQAAVTSSFANGTLSAASDAGDAIAVTCAGGQARVNGADPGGAPVACQAVIAIAVTGGPAANVIDLSGVTTAAFPAVPGRGPLPALPAPDPDVEDERIGLPSVTIDGAGGPDTITGGETDDEILGFDGDDTLRGGPGIDQLAGEGGDDATFGGDGDDLLGGGEGTNTLHGEAGADRLVGGRLADVLRGGDGDDVLLGNQARDELFGEGGSDRLTGDTDLISARGDPPPGQPALNIPGDDLIDGGAGTDTVRSRDGGITTLSATRLARAGTDALMGIERALIIGGGSNDIVDASTFPGPSELRGGAALDRLIGGPSGDTLMGQGGEDTLSGNGGDDVFAGGAQTDTVAEVGDTGFQLGATTLTGQGTDEIGGDVEQVRLAGGPGPDVLDAAGFPRTAILVGAAGADTLTGGAGSDRLAGGAGEDALDGGLGPDVVVEAADADLVLTATALTGNGTDALASIEQAALAGGAGANVLDASGFGGPVVLDGAAGNDTLTGGSGPDAVSGGDGDDALAGGPGDDRVTESGGSLTLTDTALTGRGTDTLTGIERAALSGGPGNDVLDASAYSSPTSLIGAAGADTLAGGAAADAVAGGAGDDRLMGGAAADALEGDDGADLLDGAGGNDDLDGGRGADDLTGAAGDDGLAGGADDDRMRGGAGDDELRGEGGADDLGGEDGADSLTGGPEADAGDGGPGDDTLQGSEDGDTLTGGDGADSISGGPGADTLEDPLGVDVFSGDEGDDRLVSRDGNPEPLVVCGPGSDRVVPDLDDVVSQSCEIDETAEPADTTPPVLGLAVAPRRFTPARRGPSVQPRRGRRGTVVTLEISEAAGVDVTVRRMPAGRRRGGLRFHAPAAGRHSFGFSGRLRGTALRPGPYHLIAIARDAAGNASSAKRSRIRIVR